MVQVNLWFGRLIKWTGIFIFIFISGFGSVRAADSIRIEIDSFRSSQIYLAKYHRGDYLYLDTLSTKHKGHFLIRHSEQLDTGMYLLVLPPKKQAVQFVIHPNAPASFSIHINGQKVHPSEVYFRGSDVNENLYRYLSWLNDQRRDINQWYRDIRDTSGQEVIRLTGLIDQRNRLIRHHQDSLLRQYPADPVALWARLDREPLMDAIPADTSDFREQRYLYRRAQYWDSLDLSDPRMADHPRYYSRLRFFVHQLSPQQADSLIQIVDTLIKQIKPFDTLYQHTVNYLIQSFDPPRVIGTDAVYVHLVKKYLAAGPLGGMSQQRWQEIQTHATRLSGLLIGQQAPPLVLQDSSGRSFSIRDIETDYLLLVFWRPNCGHCKKALPHLKSFYKEYKNKGVEILGVCTRVGKAEKDCWPYVEEQGLDEWLQGTDPYHKSQFLYRYLAQRTPKIYLLDRDKNILLKDFGASDLPAIMKRYLTGSESPSTD